MKKIRRSFGSVEKAALVKRHLVEGVPVLDLCDEYQLQPTQIYSCQKQLFDNAAGSEGADRTVEGAIQYNPSPQFSGLPSAGPRGNPTMDRIGKTELVERESPQEKMIC